MLSLNEGVSTEPPKATPSITTKCLPPYAPDSLPVDKTLVFESRFESGNLRKAMKVGPFDYELYLKTFPKSILRFFFTCWYVFQPKRWGC